MQLYSDNLLNDLANKSKAQDSILTQMASGPDRNVLEHLGQLFNEVASPVQDRWADSLRSTDNRRFFQGFGEAVSAAFLARAGWSIVDLCEPKPCLVAQHPDGRSLHLVTLAFLKQPQRHEDKVAQETLARVLNRTVSDRRITILVRKWNAHRFDPEPVRRCVDIWLTAIKKGEWQGRYATYEDDHIHLEFARTEEATKPGQGAVAFLIAPPNGQHTMDVVETRLVYELDNMISMAPTGTNILVSMVTNTAWGLPPGLVRSLFYGRPIWSIADGHRENRKFAFQFGDEPALFHEERYHPVSGMLLVDRPKGRGPCGRAYLNPWSSAQLGAADLAAATFGSSHSEFENGYRVMRWSEN
jgi:hypothetical protein